MAYLSIDNLYKSQDVLLFKEVWALEKVHGTSAHVAWQDGALRFFSGGSPHDQFVSLFDQDFLAGKLTENGYSPCVIYGEAYGGKCQGMSAVYGKELRFVVFDVKMNESWLAVPDMDNMATALGLEVVPYRKVPAVIDVLDAERDRISEVAMRRGCFGPDKLREGIVIRPLIELKKNNGERVIAKHKADKFSERATPQKVDKDKLVLLTEAKAVADEWVTEMRLSHVLDKMPGANIEQTKEVILAMQEDVKREAAGEIVESKEVWRAIGARTANMFKERLKEALHVALRQ